MIVAVWTWFLDLLCEIWKWNVSLAGWALNVIADCYNLPSED